jgi:energy-coupling factor transporter ATP-binding protein EcfA2
VAKLELALVAKPNDSLATSISDRLSQEIVIALVGPVGSGVSTAAKFLAEVLDHQFRYQVAPTIRPSDIIRNEAHRVGITPPARAPLSVYIDQMQTAGNTLRERFGGNYLAEKAVERIVAFRRSNGGYSATDVVLPGRLDFTVIDEGDGDA